MITQIIGDMSFNQDANHGETPIVRLSALPDVKRNNFPAIRNACAAFSTGRDLRQWPRSR
jgi:hypothetical protein